MTTTPLPPVDRRGRVLRRGRDGRPPAPVRIAHLGLGNFFRAHQAWYTDRAQDADQWGIAAFTGRSPGITPELAEQECLYTVLVRGPDADRPEVVSSLTQVGSSADPTAWRAVFARPELAVVTLTVTEAGYRRDASGRLDLHDPEVAGDVTALRGDPLAAPTVTAPGKLVAGFAVRRAAGLGPLTVVPCDNVPGNGDMARRVVLDLAAAVDAGLAAWVEAHVGFVTTMVDRITPRATPADRADLLDGSGVDDPACVVTEPYSEWVLSGDFLAGRPDWASAGARFVDDLEPWEQRKLLLLNGSHSLMAYAAPLRGATTVAEAITDPVVAAWVEQWWDDAARHLPLPAHEIDAYRAALLERFRNPRIRHLLAQIAADGSQKLPIRVVPVLRAGLAAGRVAHGAVRAVAAWTLHLRGHGAPVSDPGAASLADTVAAQPLDVAVTTVLDVLGIPDAAVHAAVLQAAEDLRPGG